MAGSRWRRGTVALAVGGAVLLAFALDTWTTLAAASGGGSERNPLAPTPPSAAYVWFSLARCGLALALLALLPAPEGGRRQQTVGRVVLWGLGALVLVKLAAALSNAWLVWRGATLLSASSWPAWAGLVVLGAGVGERVARGLLDYPGDRADRRV